MIASLRTEPWLDVAGEVEERFVSARALGWVVDDPELLHRNGESKAERLVLPTPIAQSRAARMLSCSAIAMSSRCPPGRSFPALRFALSATSAKYSACRRRRRRPPRPMPSSSSSANSRIVSSITKRPRRCRTRLLSTSDSTRSASAPAIASIASSVAPPRKTASARKRSAPPSRGARSSTRSSREARAGAPGRRARA